MSATLVNNAKEIFTPPDNLPANKLMHGPLLQQLIRLAFPTAAVLFMTTLLSVAETYFVSALGLHAIAAASLVVPAMLLMTTLASAGKRLAEQLVMRGSQARKRRVIFLSGALTASSPENLWNQAIGRRLGYWPAEGRTRASIGLTFSARPPSQGKRHGRRRKPNS